MPGTRPRIVGILNMTEDSFSDGGRYLDPGRALDQAHHLVEGGADIVELGPASSHPDSHDVSARDEIRRLDPVLAKLLDEGMEVSVDSFAPETQRWCLDRGVAYLNDIQGFSDSQMWDALAKSHCKLIAMHSVQGRGRAMRTHVAAKDILPRIEAFFEERLARFEEAGIDRARLILDPGMGFFLGDDPAPSVAVLRGLPALRRRFELPVLVSVSRKSFLGVLCRDPRTGEDRAVGERQPATLAAELFALRQGADFIRTHDTRALWDAMQVSAALEAETDNLA